MFYSITSGNNHNFLVNVEIKYTSPVNEPHCDQYSSVVFVVEIHLSGLQPVSMSGKHQSSILPIQVVYFMTLMAFCDHNRGVILINNYLGEIISTCST